MGLEELGIKIRENKRASGLDSARFALSYKKNQPGGSYQILSRLNGSGDSLLEINSGYITVSGLDRELYLKELVSRTSSLNLNYRLRKVPVLINRGLFSFLKGPEKIQGEELLLYLPGHIWEERTFQRLFPIYGGRYYLLGEKENPFSAPSGNSGAILEKFYQLTDEDKLEYFAMIVFDPGDLPMMGINSRCLDLETLKTLLQAA